MRWHTRSGLGSQVSHTSMPSQVSHLLYAILDLTPKMAYQYHSMRDSRLALSCTLGLSCILLTPKMAYQYHSMRDSRLALSCTLGLSDSRTLLDSWTLGHSHILGLSWTLGLSCILLTPKMAYQYHSMRDSRLALSCTLGLSDSRTLSDSWTLGHSHILGLS